MFCFSTKNGLGKSMMFFISIVILISCSMFNGLSNKAYAQTLWSKPIIKTDDPRIKVTVSQTGLTKGPITIKIDTTRYNNGHNVSNIDNELVFGSVFTYKVKENGFYSFPISAETSDYLHQADFWCSVEVMNIDNRAPVFMHPKTKVDSFSGYMFLSINAKDDLSIRRIKLPDGTYSNYKMDWGTGELLETVQVKKNGKYTFVAEDFAGNKKSYTVTVKNYKKTPLSVKKVTHESTYITGKTLPYAIVTANVGDSRLGYFKADKKGNFKIKLKTKRKAGSSLNVNALDRNLKYVGNTVKVRVN